MASNFRSKSSQNQATLFQTWGYSQSNHQTATATWTKNNLKEHTSATEKGREAKGVKSKNGDQILVDDDLDDILECFGNDDLELCQAVEVETKATYLDGDFNPRTSPEDLPGFDSSSGHNYIYPVNYPVREYQFKIIMKALMKNTLVVLPTGLGKTFIAAVVMYNFYRWYPLGKIIFMAPTKPLVAQQIQACYNITGTPAEDTAEMTGTISPARRKALWEKKRVFFLTPHVLQNDLGRGACSANDIVCLVFDEAHKALGNYAYCQVIKEISGVKSNFRVLALSATPGGDMNAVQQVVTNLMISHVELRSEESNDIKPYVYGRNVEKIIVPLSEELKKTKQQFVLVLEGIIQRLCTQGVCWQHDATKVSKFFLLKARDQFRARGMEDKSRVGMIEGDFALAISLYHAYELLQQHGVLSFYNFLKEICSGTKGTSRGRYELMRHEKFMEMMDGLRQRIEPPDDVDGSLNGTFLDVLTPKRRLLKSIPKPNSLFSSHPKLKKLEEIVVKHFEGAKENLCDPSSQTPLNTRIMIFSQYRDSVQEITAVLSKYQPLVKVMSFVGQNGTGKGNRGLSQKEQLAVVQRFREGGYNVLVSTSVGEEGLDIGDIDLIICFDASNSPIRLVQRMGRTGRKRAGRIIILVTEGKEDQIYKRSLTNKKSIHKKLLDATNSLVLFDESPRMIPKHLNPYCLKMQITVQPQVLATRGVKRKSIEEKPKKVSRKKLDKDASDKNLDGEVEGSETKTSKKNSRKKTLKEKRLDKAKAWRRSTIQKTIDLSDDDGDFQSERNDRAVSGKVGPAMENVGNVDSGEEVDSTTEELAYPVDDEQHIVDLMNDQRALDNVNLCNVYDQMEVENINANEKSKIHESLRENIITSSPENGEDDDFICTQNIASFLPSSTPNRDSRAPRNAALKSNALDAAVPPPPACDDLDNLDNIDADFSSDDLLNKNENSSYKGIGGKCGIALSNKESHYYSNLSSGSRKWNSSLNGKSFQKAHIFTQPKDAGIDASQGFGVVNCKNNTSLKDVELSTLDLFGDSLMGDFEDEFEDCPSPPVVCQVKTTDAKDQDKSIKSRSESFHSKEHNVLGAKNERIMSGNVEQKLDCTLDRFDKTKDSLFGSYKNGTCDFGGIDKNDSIDDIDLRELNESITCNVSDDETGINNELPVLSLSSRLKNRRNFIDEETNIENDAKLFDEVTGDSNGVFCRRESTDAKVLAKDNYIHCNSTQATSKEANSSRDFDVEQSPRLMKPSVVCSDKVSARLPTSSDGSTSDYENPMPSLATRLKSRSIPLLNNHKVHGGLGPLNNEKNEIHITDNTETDLNAVRSRHLRNNLNPTCSDINTENLNSDSHLKGESPHLNNNRRRRKAVGRILDDSPSPRSSTIPGNNSSDDEFENCILRRRKTKKVGFFKSPAVSIGAQSSDEDFDCGTSLNQSAKKNSRKVKFSSNKNVKGASKKRLRTDFIDDEAELSGDDSGDEIYPDGSQYVMDSFIDDATQMTQVTPMRNRKGAKESVDMAMIYRQSLFSPMYEALNFHTPGFKANRNRYKMVGRSSWQQQSDDDDEAAELNSFIDDGGEFDEDNDCEDGSEQVPTSDEECLSDGLDNTKLQSKSDIISPPYRKKKSRLKRILSSDDEEPIVDEMKSEDKNTTEIERPTRKSNGSFDETNKVEFTRNGPIMNKDCSPSSHSMTANEKMVNKNRALYSLLIAEDFQPCFDFGLDLGPRDLQVKDESRKDNGGRVEESVNTKTLNMNPFIFANTKIVASSQVGSILRLKHHVQLTVCSQLYCDFVVSKRMGVLRKVQSDISNGSNNAKTLSSIKEMMDHYGRACVIIEKDRIKGSTAAERHFSYTKYFTGLLAYLAENQIKVLFSDSQEDTAFLVYRLAEAENEADFGLNSISMKLNNNSSDQLQKVLLTIPYISYPLSVKLCNEFKCLKPLIKSSPEEIKARIPEVSALLAKKIVKFFHHKVLTI